MKTDWTHLDPHRLAKGPYASPPGSTFGAFEIPHPKKAWLRICIIASDGMGVGQVRWEHVSVHVRDIDRSKQFTPVWEDMDWVKDLFWDPTETVVQYHVPKSDHINLHPHVLHLWRCPDQPFPMPPKEFV